MHKHLAQASNLATVPRGKGEWHNLDIVCIRVTAWQHSAPAGGLVIVLKQDEGEHHDCTRLGSNCMQAAAWQANTRTGIIAAQGVPFTLSILVREEGM